VPLLEVKNLVKTFVSGSKTTDAVSDVSFSLESGETLGLVGESGCGKTTLSRCILHLEKPISGTVVFDGIDLSKLNKTQLNQTRKNMQIVFQDPYASLDPRWTIGRILDEPLRVHNIVPRNVRPAEISKLLESVGLPSSASSRYPHEFSGGQRQRIGIARALATRPKFIIADEPVSALDISVRAQILNLLRDIQRQRSLAILFIAHDLAAVRQVSSRIAVMYQGKIVEISEVNNLFENPSQEYTKKLLSAIPNPRSAKLYQSSYHG
jgi:ABC-type oligopeptide transport system ATPase subunit